MPLRFFLYFLVTLFVVLIGNGGFGIFPPIGRMLSPFAGVWRLTDKLHDQSERTVDGLREDVEIFWDGNGIPHIFAKSLEDLYFAQGYVVAAERLFQMDLQTRVGGGRLSEWVGERGLKTDRFFIGLGNRRSSRLALEEMQQNPQTALALQSYTKGVNAWISSLRSMDLPFEYQLLGVEPEPWTEMRTAYLMKLMSFGLAGNSLDLEQTRWLKEQGRKNTEFLFPDIPGFLVPVVGKALEPRRVADYQSDFVSHFVSYPHRRVPDPNNGSNNWAVAAKKSTTGFPILANDTHLEYKLPGLWYEMRLSAPGLDVYGVTFPAAPGIIIGFNPQVAWAVTNSTMDVLDFYEVEWMDSQKQDYVWDSGSEAAQVDVEEIKIKGGITEIVPLKWTRQGVVVAEDGDLALSMAWRAHQASNELFTFMSLNQASDFSGCRKTLSGYSAPAQNFICVDREQIGIFPTGRFADRSWGYGRYVLNGRTSETLWPRPVPLERMPASVNPESGYVLSANQHPFAERDRFYPGWFFDDSYRALRIRDLLEGQERLSATDFQKMQNDIHDLFAARTLPLMLEKLGDVSNVAWGREMVSTLKAWDFENRADSEAAAFFQLWVRAFEDELWGDQMKVVEGHPLLYPKRSRLEALLSQSESEEFHQWIDDVRTEEQETLAEILHRGFVKAMDGRQRIAGSSPLTLEKVRPTKIEHVAKIPGLGRSTPKVGGGTYTINANRGDHGAVWRMIVEMGPEPKAYVNSPGGPSGNPLSRRYDKFVEGWAKGELREVSLRKRDDLERLQTKITLRSREARP